MAEAKCPKCDYKWDTTSKMLRISCPRCGKTINNSSVVESD